jgi:hypothetical protein
MGRPIKKKFFGNLSTPPIGGESLATISVINSGTLYSQGATAVVSNPELPDGVVATATAGVNNGGVTAVSIDTAGSGYTNTATVTITTASGVTKTASGEASTTTITVSNTSGIYVGMIITGDTGLGDSNAPSVIAVQGTDTVVASAVNDGTFTSVTLAFRDFGSGFVGITSLTNSNQNSIAAYAFIPAADGGTSGLLADIVKQESSRRYLVKTSEGTGQVRLTAAATGSLAAGQMNIIATDVNGSTYYVTKLTARRAYVTTATDNGGFEYADGTSAGWSLAAATTGTLSLANN